MTRHLFALTIAGLLVPLVSGQPVVRPGRAEAAAPALLRVSAANPHYLEYRGRPLLLISSAEHYGAVINQDFDFVPAEPIDQGKGKSCKDVSSGPVSKSRPRAGTVRNSADRLT